MYPLVILSIVQICCSIMDLVSFQVPLVSQVFSYNIKNLLQKYLTRTKWEEHCRQARISFIPLTREETRFHKQWKITPDRSCPKCWIFITVSAGFKMRKFLFQWAYYLNGDFIFFFKYSMPELERTICPGRRAWNSADFLISRFSALCNLPAWS